MPKSIMRIIRAFGYSFDGLKAAFQSEAAFRQELLLVLLLTPVALLLEVSLESKALMIASLFLILMAELVNTAIEAIIDRISEETHPLSKKAKDVGSALVLIAFINAISVWAIIVVGLIAPN